MARTCTYIGGQYQYVENTPAGAYITGESCQPPQNIVLDANVARIDLCPPEWGGYGNMRLDDPRCVRPVQPATLASSGNNGTGSAGLLGSRTIGPSLGGGGLQPGTGSGGGGGGMNGFTFNGTFNGGCGCGPGTSIAPGSGGSTTINTGAFVGSSLFWVLVALGIVVLTRRERR